MATTRRRSEKLLIVTMPDGSKWAVPAEVIAHDFANHYRENNYREEYDYALGDDNELMDWAANNMNWSDVADNALRFSDPEPPDMQEGWVNGDKKVIPATITITISDDIGEVGNGR